MKTKFYYLIIILCCFAFQNSYSAIIYVNDGFTTGDVYCTAIGNDTNSGLTPALPKRTMAAAIAATTAGDTIYVDSGTYGDDSIAINKALTIIGAGTGKTIFDNGNAAQLWANITASNVTVKSIMMTQYFNAVGSAGQVININGAYTNILLDNILITKSLGASSTLPNINISGGASVTIKNSFLKCSGYNGSMGGGILVNNSTLVVINTLFYQNESATSTENGGALQVKGASANVTVTNCTFDGCVSLKGGAIGQNAGTLSVSGSCFSNNISETDDNTSGGGAIFVNGTSNTTISNCTFNNNAATNQAQGSGGAIAVGTATSCDGAAICFKSVTGTASVTNCSFSNNGKLYDGSINPFDDGQDIYYSGASLNITIENNSFSPANSGEVNIFEDGSGNQTMSNNGVYTQTGSTAPTITNLIPTRTDVTGFGTWTDYHLTGTTTLSMLGNLLTPIRTGVYSTCSTVVFAGWTDTSVNEGGTACNAAINTSGYINLQTSTSSTISPAMDFTVSPASKYLTFRARTFGGINAVANTVTVSISTDNGGTWTTLGTRTPVSTTLTQQSPFDLSTYTGTQVKIRFQSLAATGTVGVGIDDISITNASTTITPSMDFSNKGVQAVYTQALVGGTNTTYNVVKVSISQDNGSTWTQLSTINTAGTYTLDLSSYHSTTTKLKFETPYANGATGASLDNITFNSAAASNSNPVTACTNSATISKCNAPAVNCTTETVAPVIISCVPNKSLTCPAILPDYRNEVNAYDDCTITIVQSPAAGMLLPPGTTTVTMTVTDQNNNSTTCTFTVTVAPATAPSNFGNFASAVSISTNGGTTSAFYNTTGTGADLIGTSTFTGTNLGTHTSNSGTLKLTGAEFKSWKNGTGNVCGGTFYYVVYPTGARPSAPSFQNFSIPWKTNCGGTVFNDGLGPCSGNDQKWSTVAQNIDLTTYANGNYTLEIYYLETGSDSGGGCGTNLYINNSCNNYTATFTIGAACIAPSISANPTATQTVCKDAATTNLSVTASGTGISYQWYSNTTNSTSGGTSLGTSAQASTYTPSSATAGTTYYYCVVTGTCGTATSTVAEVVVEATTVGGTVSSNQDICTGTQPADLTLTGHTGSVVKWQKATDAAFTSPIDITNTSATLTGAAIGNLTATTYFRAVVQNGTCATANSGVVTITVPSSTWNGTAWSNGTPTLATTVTFTGNYPPTTGYTPEDLYACSVTVTNGANVVIPSGYNYTVYGKVTVDSGSTLTFNNNANLLQQTDVANTGNISMKRNTNPLMRLDYTLWSGPVTGQNLLAFSPSTLSNRFYTYNTDTNLYNAVNASTTYFAPGVGYQIRVPNNHPTTPTIWTGTFIGVPNNGPYTTTIANLGVGKRFNMVGNPYPSPIDLFDFVGANSANITGTLYFWRKTNSTITQSVWSTWNNGTFVAASEPYVTDPNDIARNGQGFFVEASATGTAITFNNSMRVLDNANQFFRNSNPLSSNVNTIEKHRIWLNVFDSTGDFFQQAVTYTQGGTVELDAFDGKNMNNTTMMFTSIIPSSADKYVIQSRPLPFDENDMVPLSFRTDVAGTYSIGIDHKDGLFTGNTQDIFIKDNFYNTYNNLNNGAYQFTTDAGTFDNRFELRFVDAALSNNEATFSNQVIVYNSGDDVVVRSSTETIKDIKVFDVRGRLLYSKKNINSNEIRIQLDVAQEMLLIEITSQEGLKTIKKIIN